MGTIKIVSKKHEHVEGLGTRAVEVDLPKVLTCETLGEFVEIMGEDFCRNYIHAQMKITFRSHIRTKMDSIKDGEFTISDEEIMALVFEDWKPEGKVRISNEDKAMAALSKLDPEALEAVLAEAKRQADKG